LFKYTPAQHVKHAESRGSGGMPPPPEKFLKVNAKMLQFYAVLVKKYAYIWHAILAAYNILAMYSYLR